MNIEMKDLFAFVAMAVDAGVQSYMRSVEPSSDCINQADAKKFVKKMGFQPVMLSKWSAARLITPVKVGERQNAPVMYSLAEIKKVISSLKLKNITNNVEHDKNF